jgi:hypothetical protein
VERVAADIALVTVPPEGGIYYREYWLITPLPPALVRGAINDRDELVLGPNELVSMLGADNIALNAHVSVLRCLSAVTIIGRPCKVVVLPAAIYRLILKRLRTNTTAAGWGNHASCWVLEL